MVQIFGDRELVDVKTMQLFQQANCNRHHPLQHDYPEHASRQSAELEAEPDLVLSPADGKRWSAESKTQPQRQLHQTRIARAYHLTEARIDVLAEGC